MGIRATGRVLMALGPDGAVQTVAPCSLSDPNPSPAFLSKAEFQEVTGPARIWASEGGKYLAVKSTVSADAGFELVNLATGYRSSVPFEVSADLAGSVASRGSNFPTTSDWERVSCNALHIWQS